MILGSLSVLAAPLSTTDEDLEAPECKYLIHFRKLKPSLSSFFSSALLSVLPSFHNSEATPFVSLGTQPSGDTELSKTNVGFDMGESTV